MCNFSSTLINQEGVEPSVFVHPLLGLFSPLLLIKHGTMHQLYHSTFMTSTSFCFLPWASNELSVWLFFLFHPSCLLSPGPTQFIDLYTLLVAISGFDTYPSMQQPHHVAGFVVINPLKFFFLIKAIAIASRCLLYSACFLFFFSLLLWYDVAAQDCMI